MLVVGWVSILLQETIPSSLPQTGEAWAFLTLLFTTGAAAVRWWVIRWSDARVAEANAEAKAASEQASALALAQNRLIDTAEKREERAERREEQAMVRLEMALSGMAELTQVVTELTAINKATLEEVRRANDNFNVVLKNQDYIIHAREKSR